MVEIGQWGEEIEAMSEKHMFYVHFPITLMNNSPRTLFPISETFSLIDVIDSTFSRNPNLTS